MGPFLNDIVFTDISIILFFLKNLLQIFSIFPGTFLQNVIVSLFIIKLKSNKNIQAF